MRRMAAIVVAIVVAASCIPWLRHQPFFSVVVTITALVLAGFIVVGCARALSKWRKQKHQQGDSMQPFWLPPRARNISLGAALILVLMLTVPHFVATSGDAYKLAVVTAHQSAKFNELLGAPVREAWFSEGKVELGNPATANLLIPVHGRLRSGNLRVLAVKNDGGWRLEGLTLELAQPGEQIDLLADSR